MTYQTLTADFSHESAAARAWGGIKHFFRSVARAIELNSTAHRKLTEVQHLQSKTDAELTELGIERDQIVHHVFRDLFYI